MISFVVKMRYELADCSAEGTLAKQDQAVLARFFDGSHKAFRMCIQFGDCGGSVIYFTPALAEMS